MSRSDPSRTQSDGVRHPATAGAGPTSAGRHQDAEPAVSLTPLASLRAGASGRVVRVTRDLMHRAERLAALGVTPGAKVRVLQTFPGIIFQCDETELAIERAVARAILIAVEDGGRREAL
jgi:Fe2+ transport system protein FeoA